jgi:hypothetical protein
LKTVDDVLFVSGNSDAVFVICFHFLGDLVYYPVAAQMRIGLGIAPGSVEKIADRRAARYFRAALATELKAVEAFLERKI